MRKRPFRKTFRESVIGRYIEKCQVLGDGLTMSSWHKPYKTIVKWPIVIDGHYLAVVGIQKRHEPEKSYYFIISVLWSDRSEIVIYRTLRQIKQIMIQVNQFVPDDSNDFQKETDFVLKKSNYLNLETGISWHLKCCESISIFFTKIVDLRTILLNSDVLKHLKPRSVCHFCRGQIHGYHEMPQKACKRWFYHVIAFS